MDQTDRSGALFLGIDGGGSKCCGRLVNGAGEVLAVGMAGSANAFQNRAGTEQSIVACAGAALASAGLPHSKMEDLVVVAGLAGVNVPRVGAEMGAWGHPFARLDIHTDIHIACVAAHGGEGAVIVVGTGSVGYLLHNGVGRSFGGHGFTLGDQGSGAWLGLQALRAVLLARDGLGPATRLTSLIEAQLDCIGLALVDVMAAASSRDFGALAPLVLAAAELGDDVATAILDEGAAYLDAMARSMLAGGAVRISLLGGLAGTMAARLSAQVRAQLSPALGQPEEGAVQLALAQAAWIRSPVSVAPAAPGSALQSA